MRLAEFIKSNREPILAEWEAFARTCTPASGSMDIVSLRDHANQMLTVIAADLETSQNKAQQKAKSEGNAPAALSAGATAAEEHGAGRAESGFLVSQMVAEFRALRASVIRLWTKSQGPLTPDGIEDLTRFNEAIDQSLAESVSRYTAELDNSREMFLGILGHDLRSPLGAITTTMQFMLDMKELREPYLTLTGRAANSAKRMQHMIDELLDFTRSRLGGGIPILAADMSIDKAVHDVVGECAAAHPGRVIRLDARSGIRGEWDCARLSQVLSNIISNALQHGSPDGEIKVTVRGDSEEVTVAIHNYGPAIPHEHMNGIFGPMKRKNAALADAPAGHTHLGLGLYIAERIVSAHNGRIDVESSNEGGTTFTVHLPRTA